MPKRKNKKDEEVKNVSNYAVVYSAGFNVILTIFLGGLLGWLLDNHLGTDYCMVIGIILFTLVAIYNFFRSLMRLK